MNILMKREKKVCNHVGHVESAIKGLKNVYFWWLKKKDQTSILGGGGASLSLKHPTECPSYLSWRADE